MLYSNIFRVYGKLFEIAFSQTILPVLILFSTIFFRGESLLWALVVSNFLSILFPLFIYIIRMPLKIKLLFIPRLFRYIQKKAWYLFIYNSSFYLIAISTRSFISNYYSVEEFGYYSFSFMIANVFLLLLQSLSFLVFPKMLNRLRTLTIEKVTLVLKNIRIAYVTTSHILVHLFVCISPLFFFIFSEYEQSQIAFKLTALTLSLHTNSFGYSALIIAREKEKKLSFIALLSLAFNVILSYLIINVFDVGFSYVIISTLVTYLIYTFFVGKLGQKLLKLNYTFCTSLKDIYPIKIILPFIISLIFIICSIPDFSFLIPLLLSIFLNYEEILKIKKLIINIIVNPQFVNL
jgi:O-antigen/teichoic acid export membrane protein